jgi:two-component system nitrogen regulation response regulator GlnG
VAGNGRVAANAVADGVAPMRSLASPVARPDTSPEPAPGAPAERADAARRADAAGSDWLAALERRARELLLAGEPMVWDTLSREFEAQLIRSALATTRGRRIEAALKLGIGRNTITRKIQELGIDDK